MDTGEYVQLEKAYAELNQSWLKRKKRSAYFQGIAAKSGQDRIRERTQLGEYVSEIKQAREHSENERIQLLSIFDSIDKIIFVSCIYTGNILYANRQAYVEYGALLGKNLDEHFFGVAPSECPGNRIKDLLAAGESGLVCEFQNPLNKKLYRNISRCLTWPEQGMVRYDIVCGYYRKPEVGG